ncbi:MAG: glycoside hydrolase family 26 protein [Moorellaceae bacterium]
MSNHKWLILVALLFVALTAARAGSRGFSGELDLSTSRYVTPPLPTPPEDGEFPRVERKELVNEYDGFKIQYPEGWQTEIIPGVVTVLTCPGAKLFIFVQPLGKITAEEYILYSNRSLQEGWGTIRLLQQKKLKIKGYPAWQFDWTRDKIAAGDLNYYREYHIIVAHTVYTFMLKTEADHFEAAAEELSRMLVTWRPIAAKGLPSFPEPPRVERRVELEGENHRLVIPADKTLWGILNPHKLGRLEYFRQLLPLEQKLDYKFEFLITYAAFDTHFSPEELRKIYNDGRILMVALQPWWYGKRDDTSLIDLLKGKYDGIFREWARQFKALGDPVFVRFGNEMNGDWSTWSAWFYGKDTDIFKMAWQHVYRLFKEEGADNVVFVFNPHDRSFPNFKWNNYLLYYPGDDTVDWIGLTGYNNGTSHAADVWREFEAIYKPLYREYMYYFGDKPFIITEFASNEVGGNKANWIKRAMESLAQDYPNIKIAVWFNQIDGRWLYNLDSSPESFRAFKEGLKNPCYQFRAVWPRQK